MSMQESYIETVKRNDIEIGEIWLEGDGYTANPYFSGVSHAGFENLEEARGDVNDIYDEYLYHRQKNIESILIEYKDELMRKPKK